MTFESLHNYYERLVSDHLLTTLGQLAQTDPDYLEDIACVALNQLPARYIRHDVDFVYYLPADERIKIDNDVRKAVDMAIEFVSKRRKMQAG